MFKRKSVNKRRSSNKFRRKISRTKLLNMRSKPQRGGWRL